MTVGNALDLTEILGYRPRSQGDVNDGATTWQGVIRDRCDLNEWGG